MHQGLTRPAPAGEGRWRLLLAGDVMLGRGIDQALAHPCAPALHEPWVRDAREYLRLAERANGPIPAPLSPAYVWGDALALLARAAPDLRIVNLETTITDSDRHCPGKAIHYRMHPANVDCLLALKPDCCVLANNHVLDWGANWVREVPGAQRAFARRLLDSGAADAIHGHSSHHPLPLEIHRGRPVLHGCGDLVNDYEGIGAHGGLRSDLGCLYLADFDVGTRRCVELRVVPLQLRRFRLAAPDDEALAWLAAHVAEPTDASFTRLARDQETLRWHALT